MKVRQWEIWKCKPAGFEKDHWFVIVSGQERLDHPHALYVNALACYTLRGDVKSVDVRLNSADGFAAATVCQCDFMFILEKSKLHSCLGSVS